jgi:hypothetical protein
MFIEEAGPLPAPRRSSCLKAWRRSLMRIKLSGPNSVMLFGAERQGMVLGGGASSPVAKEGPLSSGGLFHFAV